MASPLRIQYPGAFYHVTARGNEQKDISRVAGIGRSFMITWLRPVVATEPWFIATV